MYSIIIDMETEKSAEFLMKELIEKYPLLDGRIRKYQEPKITTLDRLIDSSMKKGDKL
jgi:hypothetical protein